MAGQAGIASPQGGAALADKLATLLSHHNDFPLDVQMLPGSTLRIGQPLQIRVTSPVKPAKWQSSISRPTAT